MSTNPWLDVTQFGVYRRDPITIRVGRQNWSGRVDPASARATYDNRDGRWSRRNPVGPYHGQLVRNMSTRIGVRSEADAWLEWTESTTGKDIISTPDDASLDITGDIDIRIEIQPTHDIKPYGSDGFARLASRSAGAAGWRLLALDIDDFPDLLVTWWDSGGSVHNSYFSDAAGGRLPRSFYWTRRAYRFQLDVSTGTVEWFTAPLIGGSWTSAGTEVQGATSIGATSTALVLGGLDGAPTIDAYKGRLYAFQLRDGIDGTVVADLDLTGEDPGTTSITDGEGLDWTVGDEGRVTDTLWRVQGEVASWPTRWTMPADSDQWVPLEINGQLRRLSQGHGVVRSALRRGIVRERLSTNVIGYWSMEDRGDRNLRRMGPAIGTKTLVRHGGTPNPASNSDFLASDRIPTFDDDVWITNVDPHPRGDEWMVRILFSAGDDAGDDIDFLEVVTTDLIYLVRYRASTGGDLRVLAYNLEGTVLHDSSWIEFDIANRPVRLMFGVRQSGADLDIFCYTLDAGTDNEGGFTQTISSVGAGSVTRIRLNKNRTGTDIALGHLTVETVLRTGDLIDDLAAYDGETAAARIRRLCIEEGLDYRILGGIDDSVRMGPQPIASLVDLLQECADTDLGALYDSSERVAIGYRTGASIRNQPEISFDYAAGQVDGLPDLDDDDQGFANDITVTNWDGSEFRAQILEGPDSVFIPPSGAGRYEKPYSVNADNPDALEDHASARLSLHSVDEPRISRIRLDLAGLAITPTLRAQILALRIGDRINIQGLPTTIHPADLAQIIQGWTETLIPPFEHWLDLVTTPASPWDTGVIEGSGPVVARYDTAGAALAADVAQGASSMSVATTLGPLWTTDSGDLPFDVLADGIRVTVTAISGTSSPQTFTVTGATVLRALSSGGEVRLADPTLYSL